MTQKSATTLHHLDRARAMHLALTLLNDLDLDVVHINHHTQDIVITAPHLSIIATHFKNIKSGHRVTYATLTALSSITVTWVNPAAIKESVYAKG